MKIAHISALAALVVASQVAFAQAPMNSGSSMGMAGGTTTTTTTTGGGAAAAGDAGSVSNAGSMTGSDTTITDTSTTDTSMTDTAPKGEMANTGGEPQLMLMAGLVLAACGLLLRRKMAGQAI